MGYQTLLQGVCKAPEIDRLIDVIGVLAPLAPYKFKPSSPVSLNYFLTAPQINFLCSRGHSSIHGIQRLCGRVAQMPKFKSKPSLAQNQ